MKKLINIFICLIFLGCAAPELPKKQDPIDTAFLIPKEHIDKYSIKKDLEFMLSKYNKVWNKKEKDTCINLLYYGQQEFNIDYKVVLAIIAIESEFKITAKGKNKHSDGKVSYDYGLSQQNNRYIKDRYKATEEYLFKYKFRYTNSKYDMNKNIFSCFMLLRDIQQEAILYFPDFIKAYNVGTHGITLPKKKERATKYYNKFMTNYIEL